MSHFDVIIVGGGHGGAQAAISLRQLGFEGSLAIIGEEPDLPYERPPLSKEYFSGDKSYDRLLIRPEAFWADRDVAMVLGERVVSIDAAGHRASTASSQEFSYGQLIWAAGGAARTLPVPGGDLDGVMTMRTRADADAMKDAAQSAENIVVIGGGYIGLEAAAVLSKLGRQVVLLEGLDRVLARVAGEQLSRFFEEEHRNASVDVRLEAAVTAIEGDAKGQVTGVRLADGEIIPADLVVVGIGIIPAVQALQEAGAVCDNGAVVDEYCRTSLPGIYAIGDCASHANDFAGGATIRLESVQNASDMAKTVASAIMGEASPYAATPWFWSNQFDLKLQTVGLSSGHDDMVLRGDPASRQFSCIYLKDGKIIAIDCVNAVKDYVQGKKLVEQGAVIPPDILSSPEIPLKEALAQS